MAHVYFTFAYGHRNHAHAFERLYRRASIKKLYESSLDLTSTVYIGEFTQKNNVTRAQNIGEPVVRVG